MNSHLAALRPLLAAPWRWRLNRVAPIMLWGGALALVLLLALITLLKGWQAGAASAGLSAAGLLVTAAATQGSCSSPRWRTPGPP